MRKDVMATTIGTERNLVEALINLIELDYDAVEAYEAAIERLDDATSRPTLASFKDDHQRHIHDLSSFVRRMGGEVPTSGDFKRVLTKGKVVIGEILGDRGVLMAMRSNEDDTNMAYEHACARTDLSQDLRHVLDSNLADERRHRAWIVARIEQMKDAPDSSSSVSMGR
jgi:uncharacterized protein (TIGR02284 family)